jgi:hypothetical protein
MVRAEDVITIYQRLLANDITKGSVSSTPMKHPVSGSPVMRRLAITVWGYKPNFGFHLTAAPVALWVAGGSLAQPQVNP